MSLLHRQIPSYLRRDNREAWIAFKPRENDHGQLSVSCDLLCSAAEAYARYVARKNPKGKNLESDGVLSVHRDECADLNRTVTADPLDLDDAHTLIGFAGLDDAGVMSAAIDLHGLAKARGWQFQP